LKPSETRRLIPVRNSRPNPPKAVGPWEGIGTEGAESEARMNVLVVDDESGIRSVLAMILKLAGHQAHFATDGDEALEMFDRAPAPFDLVITDHQMARVSGLELARGLRSKGFKRDIIVVTAYAATLDLQEYEKLDIVGIMKKPFDITELRRWVESCRLRSEKAVSAVMTVAGG
jgi:two-component system response regulator (stage 0 sporulation protein F)